MSNALNFQIPVGGFGSYLQGILPDDQAVLAGAFATAMQQINNVSQVDLQKFAQVVFSGETTIGLPLIGGTDVPTDVTNAAAALGKVALGMGPYGTYTNSNFFGAMSGLPYPLQQIQQGIQQLQTVKLENIYNQLYLAVSWTQATATATVTLSGGNYSLTGFTITNPGGGYGRGSASAPTVTVTGGNGFNATATAIIGTDATNLTTFGQVIGFTITNAGTQTGNPGTTTVQIQAPPTATLPVNTNGSIATGGTNTTYGTNGWSGYGAGMDAVVQAYITQANTEIIAISTSSPSNFQAANALNANYNSVGTALKQEQRARYIAIPPVPIPYNQFLNLYPTALYVFTDSLSTFATETAPHMAAQTLENISDLTLTGGQSIVGAMRQQRNQNRLQQVGIPLTNNIPNKLTNKQQTALALNGTLPNAVDGIPTQNNTQYTLPSYPNQPSTPTPIAAYNNGIVDSSGNVPGNVLPLLNVTGTALLPITPIPTTTPLPVVNGIPAGNTVPINLNTALTSSTLSPVSYNTTDAVNHVVTCNCDCWLT